MQIFPGIFSASHVGMQTCFGDGHPDLWCVSTRQIRDSANAYVKLFVLGTLCGTERHFRFFPRSRLFDNAPGLLRAAADEFFLPIHNHLWRVRVPVTERAGVSVLAQRRGV